MSVSIKAAFLAILAIGLQMSAPPAMAGKEKFQRTKPHVNAGTLGSTSSGPAPGASGYQQDGQAANQNPGGPRKDKIDLSVCDLATFDFDKCLN
jgi:hypothetical protein